MMWEVVRRGPSAEADDLRMAWSSPDGKWRQETVQKGYEVWHVTWMPREVRDPRRVREIERTLHSMGYQMGGRGVSVRTTDSHHILCVQAPKPVVITAPDSEVRRLLRGGLEAVRFISRHQGTHMGPDGVTRSVTVYEYQLKHPRGEWTMSQTLQVDDRTGLPVRASAWVARGLPGPVGFPGGGPFGLPPGGFGPPGGRLPRAGTDWRPELAVVEYYDHNAPFIITVPPVGCR
jgi:hypothetical protein